MTSSIEELIAGWDGEGVVSHYDAEHGAWMFIGVHSTRLGPACGGTRMRVYDTPADGLSDAMRLAAGMTFKCAVAGLPTGGGKAVLAVPELPVGADRQDLLHRYGDLVEMLRGTYRTGPDMNTNGPDMDVIGERTAYAFGRSSGNGGRGSSGPDTAVGVWHGIRAAVAHAAGSAELTDRTVLVQGVGGVGGELVELLVKDGARVAVSDLDGERVADLQQRFGVMAVPAGAVVDTDCDVYAPCATGAVLCAETIPQLRCRIVAGAANNQLATPADAARLRAAGILYAPDFVINAGGALHLIGLELLGWSDATLADRLAGIGTTLTEIFTHADAQGTTTEEAAEAVALVRLDGGPAGSRPAG
ncbi:MAG: Glu/Leu/Phe/Val dehydrogenase dimerization domain-containing protein [Mycobacteriales bacterium]